MRFLPLALAAAGSVLVVPVITGYAAAPAAPNEVTSSFDAGTLTTLAANGIEQVATSGAPAAVPADVDRTEAAREARRAVGGEVRTVVLGPFTAHAAGLTRQEAWQVVVEDTVLPDGSRGRAWVALDAASGEVLAAAPLREIDAR